MCVRGRQQAIPGHHVPVTVELCRCYLKHLCILCSASRGLGSGVWVLV